MSEKNLNGSNSNKSGEKSRRSIDINRQATAVMDDLAPSTDPDVLVSVRNLQQHFPINQGIIFQRQVGAVRAVDGISFDVRKGETLGLVGESGCGKSTTGRTILHLSKATGGKIYFEGKDITGIKGQELKRVRRNMTMIFQDPYASLNPRLTVQNIVSEPMVIHGIGTAKERYEKVQELLELVGLSRHYGTRYPHEFSGGQRQRVGIARALAASPSFIVADEPVSALDVSIQAQVVNLMEDLQSRLNLTYLFVAHDLSVVRHISDRVAVMYLGKIVELADRDVIYTTPAHPYTRALLSAVPIPDPRAEKQRKRIILAGDVPSPINPPPACRFHTRCPLAQQICREEAPEFRDIGGGHFSACHFAEDVASGKLSMV